jgi:UPF0042 nucleotide-binding protein
MTQWEDTQQFLGKFVDVLKFLLPRYEKEGKSYLTIAIGCTSGRHRSVAIVEELKRNISKESVNDIIVRHRDVTRSDGP